MSRGDPFFWVLVAIAIAFSGWMLATKNQRTAEAAVKARDALVERGFVGVKTHGRRFMACGKYSMGIKFTAVGPDGRPRAGHVCVNRPFGRQPEVHLHG